MFVFKCVFWELIVCFYFVKAEKKNNKFKEAVGKCSILCLLINKMHFKRGSTQTRTENAKLKNKNLCIVS